MTSKIVVNNIEADAGISSVTLLSHVAGHDSTQNISGINSVTANAFYGDGSSLTGISIDSTKIETGNTKLETSFFTPSFFSTQSIVTGKVAALELVEKASS